MIRAGCHPCAEQAIPASAASRRRRAKLMAKRRRFQEIVMESEPKGEKDSRLKGKPRDNDGRLPVMLYDWKEMPLTCENIWHAQLAGWPRILTYDYVADSMARRQLKGYKRYYNLDASGIVNIEGQWRDEYPFASTVENGGSTFVGHAPEAEQRAQGRLINAFYRNHQAASHSAQKGKSFFFEVRVINHPADLYRKVMAQHRAMQKKQGSAA
jgi:hypothetical protein